MNDLKKQIGKLVSDFRDHNGWEKSEEHIQTTFTIELLRILGWEGSNWVINTGQDVKTGKKPDIVLKSNSSKLLVIESKDAKKKDMLDGSYGDRPFTKILFNYCKAEGLAWGILTNFIEWRLYSVYHGRIYKDKKYAFHDLLWPNANKNNYIDLLSDEGLEFLQLISKDSLIKKNGVIDSDPIYYPEQLDLDQERIKKEFFEKIKNWRLKLKAYISRNYTSSYTADKIDLIAQKILDRMIFMDICHDKGVVNEDHIASVLPSKKQKYEELKEKFRIMDEKFNSELFAPNESDDIKIGDEVIVPIINELGAIDFSKLSVHIIGEVYENYLGELAKSSIKDEKKIQDKQKQKRKSQGIYYTPDYIVDYIVKNTVGEILSKLKTEEEIEKIRVIDPACGSGSFLIRAFDEFYNAYLRVGGVGGFFAFDLKKKILQKNLFGVDLDPKAVEIAKLNLMIKALEGAKPQDIKGKHLLPSLNLNIRCGNSLIGGEKIAEKESPDLFDDYKDEIEKLIDLQQKFNTSTDSTTKKSILGEIQIKEELINGKLNIKLKRYFANPERVKPFNYSVAFCEIFKDGGFDAVIGNPPYGFRQIHDSSTKKYFQERFISSHGSFENYILFYEQSLGLLKEFGRHGFIAPVTWLTIPSANSLRKYILDNFYISEINWLPDCVFKNAQVNTLISIITRGGVDKTKVNIYNSLGFNQKPAMSNYFKKSNFVDNDYVINIFEDVSETQILKKIKQVSSDLINFALPCSGYNPYEVGKGFYCQTEAIIQKRL